MAEATLTLILAREPMNALCAPPRQGGCLGRPRNRAVTCLRGPSCLDAPNRVRSGADPHSGGPGAGAALIAKRRHEGNVTTGRYCAATVHTRLVQLAHVDRLPALIAEAQQSQGIGSR